MAPISWVDSVQDSAQTKCTLFFESAEDVTELVPKGAKGRSECILRAPVETREIVAGYLSSALVRGVIFEGLSAKYSIVDLAFISACATISTLV